MVAKAKLRRIVVLGLSVVVWLLPLVWARAQNGAPALKLLISPKQPFVAEPDAARILLHIHNATAQTLWLYRRARGKHPPGPVVQPTSGPTITTGGSTVEVTLQPADAKTAQAVASPAEATILEYAQMPKPRLVKLAAGGDYEETSIVHLQPALSEGQKPVWGAYRLTATYGASFSNAEDFRRSVGARLWEGEVTSNAIVIELRPPLPDSVGVISGSALGPDLQPRAGIRVSISDEQGLLIDQQVTGGDGKFSFAHLPLALYWITGRREDATNDTVTFRHEEPTHATPNVNTQLVLYPPETDDPKMFVHKPVVIRVVDMQNKLLPGIEMEAVFSNGDVVDDVKAVTSDDGSAAMELLPGRSSITIKRHGCANQVERADVAPGRGADGFKLTFDCLKK